MNYTKNIVRSAFARVAGALASMAVAFFLTPIVVRTFGDHWYGLLVIAGGFTNYYYLFDFGLSTAASRYITVKIAARDDQGVNEAVSTALVIFAILGLCVVGATLAACGLAGRFAQPEDVGMLRTIILLQGIGLALGFPVKAYGGVVFAHLRHDLLEAFGLGKLVAETLIIIYILTHGYGVVAYALVATCSSQIYNVFFYRTAMRLWPQLRVNVKYFRRDLTREMFGYSVWTMVNQFSDSLRFKVDALVIGAYAGASMVTHYNIGARLGELATTLIYRATNFMAPLYTRYHAQGELEEVRAKLLVLTRVNAFLAIGGGGILMALGDAFIVRWMGVAYLDAYPVLLVLLLGLIVEATMAPASNVLYGVAKHRVFAIASVVEALANLVLSLVLIRRLGLIGVALGTTIPLLVNKLVFVPLYTCRVAGLQPRRFYMSIMPAAAVCSSVAGALYLAVHFVVTPPSYAGIALAATAPVIPLLLLSFVFLLTGEERALLLRSATVRLRSAS